MSRPTVVSFFTPNDPYPRMAARLEASCKRWGLDYLITEIESEPTWVATVSLKALYCLRWARSVEGPILWVDADGELLGPPVALYDCPEDFAVYANPKPRRWRPVGRSMLELPHAWPNPPKWFLTGTLWFNYTPHALSFLEQWAAQAKARPRDYQQLLLQNVWCAILPGTLWLPQSYCAIKGKGWHPGEEGPAVIAHDLASVMQKKVRRK